jgi:hypothetical protein
MIANVSCINFGQIDANAANIGAISWTYQAKRGNSSLSLRVLLKEIMPNAVDNIIFLR